MEFQIEEYKQLSEELRIYLKQRDFNINTARIVTVFAFTASTSSLSKNLYLLSEAILIMSTFFVLVMWYDSLRRLLAMFRISTYLIVFFEKDYKELKWHSLVARHKIHKTFFHRILGNFMFPIMASVLLIFCNYVGLSNIKTKVNYIILCIADFIFIVFVIMLVIETFSLEKKRKKDIEFWEDLKEKYSNKTSPADGFTARR